MEFKNMDEVERFIKEQMELTMVRCSSDMLNIMKDEIDKQVYDTIEGSMYERTGDLKETPQLVEFKPNSVTLEFQDNGGWYSVLPQTYGEHTFALYDLENGYTWDKGTNTQKGEFVYKPETHIVEESYNRCKNEIPILFRIYMREKGVNVGK